MPRESQRRKSSTPKPKKSHTGENSTPLRELSPVEEEKPEDNSVQNSPDPTLDLGIGRNETGDLDSTNTLIGSNKKKKKKKKEEKERPEDVSPSAKSRDGVDNSVEDDTSQKPTPDLHEDDPPVDYGEMEEGEGGNSDSQIQEEPLSSPPTSSRPTPAKEATLPTPARSSSSSKQTSATTRAQIETFAQHEERMRKELEASKKAKRLEEKKAEQAETKERLKETSDALGRLFQGTLTEGETIFGRFWRKYQTTLDLDPGKHYMEVYVVKRNERLTHVFEAEFRSNITLCGDILEALVIQNKFVLYYRGSKGSRRETRNSFENFFHDLAMNFGVGDDLEKIWQRAMTEDSGLTWEQYYPLTRVQNYPNHEEARTRRLAVKVDDPHFHIHRFGRRKPEVLPQPEQVLTARTPLASSHRYGGTPGPSSTLRQEPWGKEQLKDQGTDRGYSQQPRDQSSYTHGDRGNAGVPQHSYPYSGSSFEPNEDGWCENETFHWSPKNHDHETTRGRSRERSHHSHRSRSRDRKEDSRRGRSRDRSGGHYRGRSSERGRNSRDDRSRERDRDNRNPGGNYPIPSGSSSSSSSSSSSARSSSHDRSTTDRYRREDDGRSGRHHYDYQDQRPHPRDSSAPTQGGVSRDTRRDDQTYTQIASTLVTAITLPSSLGFVYPRTPEWTTLLNYLRKCLAQRTSPRIECWPRDLRESLDSQWTIRCPARFQGTTPCDHWETLDTLTLIEWTEAVTKENLVNYDKEESFRNLNQTVTDNPMKVDFQDPAVTANDNPALRAKHIIAKALRLHLNQYPGDGYPPDLSYEEGRELCKRVLDNLKLKGMSESSIQSTIIEIKRCAKAPEDKPGNPHRLGLLLQSILSVLTEQLNAHRMHTAVFPSSGRDHSRDSTKEKGDRKRKESTSGDRKDKKRDAPAREDTRKAKKSKASSSSRRTCDGCGFGLTKNEKNNYQLECPRKNTKGEPYKCGSDDRRNSSSDKWENSKVGKLWKEAGYNTIPRDRTVNLGNAKARYEAFRGKYVLSLHDDKLLSEELIPFSLLPQGTRSKDTTSGKRAGAPPPVGKLLLDTGALGLNVMSNEYAKRLRKHKSMYSSATAKHSIRTAAKNNLISNKIINIKVNVANERSKPAQTQLCVSAAVAPIAVDLILDRDTIKKNNLAQHFPSHFAQGELLERIQKLPLATEPSQLPTAPNTPLETNYRECATLNTLNVNPTKENWVQMLEDTARETTRSFCRDQIAARLERDAALRQTEIPPVPVFLASLTARPSSLRYKKSKRATKQKRNRPGRPPDITKKEVKFLNAYFLAALRREEVTESNLSDKSPYEREGKLALDEIPDHKLESVPTELIQSEEEPDAYLKVHIGGDPTMLSRLEALVAEFKDIFKSTVQRTASSAFDPFVLQVDEEKWNVPSNATAPRTLGVGRERELYRMLDVLEERGLIENCSDAYYSHAFLTPKSNGSWRLVLDFKGLNRATTSKYAWPIPNIKDMLNRVGDSRPAFFAVFDLTSGYYQAPIAEGSRKYTAFKTRRGVYRWKRLPMGLTDAGSYFQHQLSTKVLNGLINHTCELYLDDCMVFAGNNDEYLERLRQVFLRFRMHKVTLNPSKCHLGLTQVEYVGHTIDKNGLHFTRDKLDSVLNFPRPETKKHVKSFLGLANYFRDHIKNHSLRVQPLQDLVEGYTKKLARNKINWTTECDYAFKDIRQAIDECPLLWFVNDHSPIFLKTDASDYGIGAYLYQVVTTDEGKEVEHPIGFISKSLVSGHDSWDIPMKEGFAIFYALRKWEYLLRDRKFTILTDHENLTRLRTERNANKMVTRWFMSFQEYDIIAWIHVPGADNEVPDSFSRLCASTYKGKDDLDGQHPTAILFQLTGYEMDAKHWEIIRTKGHGHGSDRGHGGVTRTLAVLDEQNLHWPERAKDVRKFVKMCPCCQKMNIIKPVIHSYPFTLSSYGLFQTVSVDLIEQLKMDEYGMSMIVVIIDNFSRFIDLYPISDTSAEAVADALIQFTGRYKTPIRFTTDSGSNFKSNLMAGLMSRLGADHQLTKAYSKEQNALVERVNREIVGHLKAIIFDKRIHSKWSKYLPIVQRYINTSIHSATGCTPSEIVFPSGAEIDRELLINDNKIVVSAYVQEMQEAQGRIIAIAEQRLRKRDEAHLQSRKGKEPEYKVGQYVLTEHRHNSMRNGPLSKLQPYLKGPLLVIKKLTEGMYTLRDLITMRPKDFHVSCMRPYLYDERTLAPAEVAARDSFDEFVIEKVITHKGNPRGSKDKIYFLVRWAGYSEKDDTWVSWKDGRNNTAVQLYLHGHTNDRVRRLVNKDFDPNKLDEGDSFERNSDGESDSG
jgi:hypothetical protein